MKSRICSRCPTRRPASRLAVLGLLSLATLAAQPKATVPFVGCPSDGQAGPVEPPAGDPVTIPVVERIARRLAYYTAGGNSGVLAPRGWQCREIYGSSGTMLNVMPELYPKSRPAITGPIVQISYTMGAGSGSSSVAEILARLFPEYRALARAVLTDFDLPVPSGPYPKDTLIYRNKRSVEYETPAQTVGLGTHGCCLEKGDAPVSGVAILIGDNPDLRFLAVRLPRDLKSLASEIVRQVERDAAPMTGK